MSNITIVDARMGRGKSSAAIRYMNHYKGKKRFLYITPFLDEVNRICERCDFDQADNDHTSKSAELKRQIRAGHNIAATHSLFYLMDSEAIDLVREMRYSLIVDESIRVIEKLNITNKDFELLVNHLADVDENGAVHWRDAEYIGNFSGYKNLADAGFLFRLDNSLLNVFNPELLRAFDEVFMLTYMFAGQYQKAYLEFFEFPYRIVGIEQDKYGYRFSDKPDNPPPLDLTGLIHIADSRKMNAVGNKGYSLSKAWYSRRGYGHEDIKTLRSNLRKFFRSNPDGSCETRMWTCFKSDVGKLVDARTGRFRNNFLQIRARATNQYRDKTDIAYLANRFVDPNIVKFFRRNNVALTQTLSLYPRCSSGFGGALSETTNPSTCMYPAGV